MSQRFVALGDSFTEGVGDPDATRPNGVRGWADRVAEQLAAADPQFRYANLAIRGRLLEQVIAEQLEPALALQPDLVSLYAGGNDLLRPKADIDALAARLEDAVGQLAKTGATVLLFTGVDGVEDPVFRKLRGRTAIYNEHTRVIAARHGALLVDMWGMRQLRDRRLWSADRLHLNSLGHTEVAIAALEALGRPHLLSPAALGSREPADRRRQRAENLQWGREHVLPWIGRRLRGESSGDTLAAKRPQLLPVN
ncbi:SGNH/GDSL hydrolase family protein [Amycolatopsis granulosa]|uniref:SGNH/GDSL hydrolase family protein n=1 Tax=Amycolatopsis granulosa TaxID=185684 RepID=UPI00142299E9|nr:SGNH/GDSL hydrolase family protein [Amycolatopsis granulosa]NIH83448.1 lysophospholipase L1-like esterase [Amycolatopsis granulosa]